MALLAITTALAAIASLPAHAQGSNAHERDWYTLTCNSPEHRAMVQPFNASPSLTQEQLKALERELLKGRVRQESYVQWADGVVRMVAAHGDELLLFADGSGAQVLRQGMSLVHTKYAKGGAVLAFCSIQKDDDGNTLINRTRKGVDAIYTVDALGQPITAIFRHYDPDNNKESQTVTRRHPDGSVTSHGYDQQHTLQTNIKSRFFDDGSRSDTSTTSAGFETSYYDSEGKLVGRCQSSGQLQLQEQVLTCAAEPFGEALVET